MSMAAPLTLARIRIRTRLEEGRAKVNIHITVIPPAFRPAAACGFPSRPGLESWGTSREGVKLLGVSGRVF